MTLEGLRHANRLALQKPQPDQFGKCRMRKEDVKNDKSDKPAETAE